MTSRGGTGGGKVEESQGRQPCSEEQDRRDGAPTMPLCQWSRVIDKSAQAGSSSSYHSPPVAFENDIPLPVQVEVTVERVVGALIPILEDEDIEDMFR